MAGKRKEINKYSIFQARFIEQHNKKSRTLDELATEFGAARQTVSKWMTGESVPDIISLVKIAKFYDVSTDYLLGCSDTKSVDANVKVAMDYTGLTEEAIERLHSGLDYPEFYRAKKADAEKKECLRAVSALIASQEFDYIADRLAEVARWAYLESELRWLWKQRQEDNMLAGKRKSEPFSEKEQENFIKELGQIFATEGFYVLGHGRERLIGKVKECLGGKFAFGLLDIRETVDWQQFLVSKEIMSYLEKWVGESRKRAEQRFTDGQSHVADHGGEQDVH